MDALVLALAPAFACGLAVQRLLELADPVLDGLIPGAGDSKARSKKLVLGLVSLAAGVLFAVAAGIRVLTPISSEIVPAWIDVAATALVVSGGTEAMNSLMKYLGYKKEEQKAETVQKRGGDLLAMNTRTLSEVG
jgi:hypothetical protein